MFADCDLPKYSATPNQPPPHLNHLSREALKTLNLGGQTEARRPSLKAGHRAGLLYPLPGSHRLLQLHRPPPPLSLTRAAPRSRRRTRT